MRKAVQIILLLLIVYFGYRLIQSINEPVKFQNELNKRSAKTIQRLKDIRTAQVAFKSKYDRYTGSFDTLMRFINEDSLIVVKQIGSEEDSVAVAKKLVIREIIKVRVKDSLFRSQNIDSIRFVPYTGGRDQFELAAGVLETGSKVKVKVFECKVYFDVLLFGLDQQLIINLNQEKRDLDKFPGIKIGSLTELTNNAGNWE